MSSSSIQRSLKNSADREALRDFVDVHIPNMGKAWGPKEQERIEYLTYLVNWQLDTRLYDLGIVNETYQGILQQRWYRARRRMLGVLDRMLRLNQPAGETYQNRVRWLRRRIARKNYSLSTTDLDEYLTLLDCM